MFVAKHFSAQRNKYDVLVLQKKRKPENVYNAKSLIIT